MTTIEWTQRPGTKGESWNPIRARNKATGGVGHYCVHKSAGCKNCYAERFQPRVHNPIRYAAQDRDKVEIFLDEDVLTKPLRWKKPRTIFVCSMTDLFGDWVTDEMLDRIFAVMALCPRHTFIVLTKRGERMRGYMAGAGLRQRVAFRACEIMERTRPALSVDQIVEVVIAKEPPWPLPNVWAGVSVSNQPDADEQAPHLLATPAAVRIVSYEPALGWVNFAPWLHDSDCQMINKGLGFCTCSDPREVHIDQIIFGGESGHGRRTASMDWGRAVLAQCRVAGVAFFGKQDDKVRPLPPDLQVREWPQASQQRTNEATR